MASLGSTSKAAETSPLNWLAGQHRIMSRKQAEDETRIASLEQAFTVQTQIVSKLTDVIVETAAGSECPAPTTPAVSTPSYAPPSPSKLARNQKKRMKEKEKKLKMKMSATSHADLHADHAAVGYDENLFGDTGPQLCQKMYANLFALASGSLVETPEKPINNICCPPLMEPTTLESRLGETHNTEKAGTLNFRIHSDSESELEKASDTQGGAGANTSGNLFDCFDAEFEEILNDIFPASKEELAFQICLDILVQGQILDKDEHTKIINRIYLGLKNYCKQSEIDYNTVDLHHAFRVQLSLSLDELGLDNEDEIESQDWAAYCSAKLGYMRPWCCEQVARALEEGARFKRAEARGFIESESDDYEQCDLYDLSLPELDSNRIALNPDAAIFQPAEPSCYGDSAGTASASDDDIETDTEFWDDSQVAFLRPDGDIEFKSPRWLSDAGFSVLTDFLFGSRMAWAQCSQNERERLAYEAMVVFDKINDKPIAWHDFLQRYEAQARRR